LGRTKSANPTIIKLAVPADVTALSGPRLRRTRTAWTRPSVGGQFSARGSASYFGRCANSCAGLRDSCRRDHNALNPRPFTYPRGTPGRRSMPKGEKLKVIDTSNLTDADWAAIERVNRACELGGAAAFWQELKSLDDLSLQLRVVGAFFPDVISGCEKHLSCGSLDLRNYSHTPCLHDDPSPWSGENPNHRSMKSIWRR
jgi:hypothetical protein